jgi:hypothetical protein
MTQCVTARALDYAINDDNYKELIVKIDPLKLGLNQEEIVRGSKSTQNISLLDALKNRQTQSNDIK